jgi:phage tail-like protein
MRKLHQILIAFGLVLLMVLGTGAASSRSYVSGNYSLTLDGVNTGFVKSIDGGAIYAEVVNEPMGADKIVHKHIGQPKYQDFTMQIGFSMAKPVYDWIAAAWKGNYQRKNGEVTAMDFNLKPTSTKQFYNALLTEVTMPALDGASKEPAYMTVKFAPEYTRNAKAASEKSAAATAAPKGEQKTFIPSNFRLEIDGLDATKVNKIDAFTVKQTAVQNSVGDARDQQREPGKLEFPNLKVTLSAAGADGWLTWLDDFVVKGNNGQDKEKNGTIYYLATDKQTVLAKVKLYNMGIIRIDQVDSEAGSDAIQRYVAELYVERMEFEVPDALK